MSGRLTRAFVTLSKVWLRETEVEEKVDQVPERGVLPHRERRPPLPLRFLRLLLS
jgi:hypothetical protein